MMTLTQLRTFLAVAETGSVRAAAERLVVSQPSVSAAVSTLERELGVALVARQGRGLRITDAGTSFAATVRQSVGLLDRAVRDAKSLEAPDRGTVRVASVTTAIECLLVPLLARFRHEYPDSAVSLDVSNRTVVWEALRDHEADLVIAGRPPASAPARVLGKASNRLVVVGPANLDSDTSHAIPVTALGQQTWLLREEGSGTRAAADELLADLGIAPPTMILGSNGAVEEGVAAGLGVGVMSLEATAERVATRSISVLRCPGTPLDRPWHLAAHSSERLSPTAILLARSMSGAEGFSLTAEGHRALNV